MKWYVRLWEQVKAWRRGERMIKGMSHGRCFEKKDQIGKTDDLTATKIKGEPKLELVSIKVIRADGTEEIQEIDNG